MKIQVLITGTLVLLLSCLCLPALAQGADFNAAKAQYAAGKYSAALSSFSALAAKQPNNATYHYYAALCNQAMNRIEPAKQEYLKVYNSNDKSLQRQAAVGYNQLTRVASRLSTGTNSTGSSSVSTQPAAIPPGGSGYPGGDSTGTSGSGAQVKTVYEFYTSWCSKCKQFAPTFEAARGSFPGITFQSLDAEDGSNGSLVDKFSVSRYPTIVMLDSSGKVLMNKAGVPSRDMFFSLLKSPR